MTVDVVIVLAIVAVAVVLFVTEWVRYDGVALMVLLSLAISGVIPMARAIEGFANPAVVTIAAVLVLSGGLYKTGVANVVGAQVLRLAGDSPVRVTALLMLTSGLMSGVMNNTAAVALLIPVVIDISRRLGMRPSRLLIPLSFAALLGGMTTLIGTGPNILLSSILERMGQGGFGFFAFTPVGATALTLGVLYVVLAGRHFLPDRSTGDEEGGDEIDLTGRYRLAQSLLALRIPSGSALDGCSLVEGRLGQALGYDLLAVRRKGHLVRAPERDFRLRSDDVLIVEGRIEALERLRAWGRLVRHRESNDALGRLVKDSTVLAEVAVAEKSDLVDGTVRSIDFRNRFQAHVVAVRRDNQVLSGSFQTVKLEAGDALLLLGREDQLQQLRYATEFSSIGWTDIGSATEEYELYRWLMRLHIPDGSWLDGQTLEASRLRRAFDLTVLEIEREDGDIALPDASERMRAGDRLIVEGPPACFAVLEALQELVQVDERPSVDELESEDVGFAEVTLAPSSDLVGKTLREVLFRESYGLNLISIFRGGRAFHSNIRISRTALAFGDALLVYGNRKKIALLARDPRFLVLHGQLHEVFRVHKAWIASAVMVGFILAASLNLLPVYIAALLGALLMVFTGCVKGNEVYTFVEWRVVMLLGGMLALGLAMEDSGTAELIAREVVGRAAEMGPRILIASIFLICALAAQFVPTSAVAVLVAPIALSAASELDLSARALLMVVAVGSSCAFLSPFGHPVNLLVMGVGGYKVVDYTKVGAPLFLLLLLMVVFFLPLVWPL
ncbi:SLC13 family permease [Candidatus Palauibacter soopunensis]|uniref:SLC13 family permease n=1 Tax=Candidatus Palauibacter soopunensis TaxID=3056739 RepID=UPI002395DA87|nr:SLC13 family permease [Candidatus Palauibacter soopunensis]MDE2877302.1 SLC13 family permease [Candidatus Palauibacter soopunensis]